MTRSIDVGRLAPGNQWDQAMIDDLFSNRLHSTGLRFKRTDGYPQSDGCCLVIPGRYWAGHQERISEAIARYSWVLAFRMGDEEDQFDISRVTHPNIQWWVQTPRPDRYYGNARFIGVGYSPHFSQMDPVHIIPKLDVFLSAQETHARRKRCFDALDVYLADKDPLASRSVVNATAGFTQGLDRSEYVTLMQSTKIAPCPSGPESQDSFRVYEALQSRCVPIVDGITPGYPATGYWERIFPDCPFPIIDNYANLPGYIEDQLALWPKNANKIAAWWMRQKRRMSEWLIEDLSALGAI